MMWRRIFFLWALLQLLLCTNVHGQVVLGDRHSGTFRRAVNAADQGDYQTARDLLGNILKDNPLHMDALTQLGVVFMETNQQLDSAQALFNRVLAQIPEEDLYDPFSVYLHQLKARTYNLQLEPRKALSMLQVVKDSIVLDDLRAEVQQEFQHTNNAILLLDNPIQLNIRDVGKTINSEFDDHSPLVDLSGRRMYFTSRRASGNDRLLPDDQYFENIYVAEHDGRAWQKPRLVESLYNRNEHMSLLSLSPDGSQLFLYQSDGKVTRNLSVSRLINGIWQSPELLPAPINSYYDETHASLSPDQSTLYFTSNRPGGYGGLDIWAARKDAYGQWGDPWNLGPSINTAGDEESPMMHPDGSTLYYISNGPHSMGGFDVLYSQLQTDSTWARAVNMGYPVNTPDDDLFFLPTLDKSEAYLTSFRFNEEEGRSDIYNVNFENVPRGMLTVVEGAVSNPDNLPMDQIRILVWRESDNAQVGEYRPNTHTGQYYLILDAGDSYRLEEAGPDSLYVRETLHLHAEMALESRRQVLMKEDVQMRSPLVPREQAMAVNEKTDALEDSIRKYIESAPTETPLTQKQQVVPLSEEAPAPNYDRQQAAETAETAYTVQILALQKQKQANARFLAGLDTSMLKSCRGKDGFLRYYLGDFATTEEAEAFLRQMKKDPRFRDAFLRPLDELAELRP
ncbi:tetratricopeptide repeat protein [Geofilum rhodophaeum]|uniref:tetratricopeptide repeat protein n=1 Tax=Geofilum rhodophaeum TaxID=1965019 RepID=UPI000B5263CF|nr:tetratricopeptide repeat protein [Geofilum rhodophaeum]